MKWQFKKAEYQCTLEISSNDDGVSIYLQLDEQTPFRCGTLRDGGVVFYGIKVLKIEGKRKEVGGFYLDNYEEIKNYYDKEKERFEERKKQKHDEEYEAILSGKKKLEISYYDGEYLSGYTAYGISAEIIETLHCGRYINGWGLYIEEPFIDGDINKMKQHANIVEQERLENKKKETEKKEAYEKKKAKDLEGVTWDTTSSWETDEGGRTKIYTHEITIHGRTYVFVERNVFDFGVVINPCYSVQQGLEPGGLINKDKDTYYWQVYDHEIGWIHVRELSEDELRAYHIIANYGQYANASIRM